MFLGAFSCPKKFFGGNNMKKTLTGKITVSAMLIALAYIATFCTSFIKVGGFLSLDIKDAVLSIVSLMFGPLYGFLSVIAVALIEFITISGTGVYGLIMNIISSGTFALIIGYVYGYKRNIFGAISASALTVIYVTVTMVAANIFITPIYFEMPQVAVLELLPTILLFNLSKATLNASIMLILYKPLTSAFKKFGLIKTDENVKFKYNWKSVVLLIVAVLLICGAIFVFNSLGIKIEK